MKGCCVVVTSKDGHVVGTGTDFDQGYPAGVDLQHMQEMRAKDRAWRDVFNGLCHPDIAKAITGPEMLTGTVSRAIERQCDYTVKVIVMETERDQDE